MRATIKRDITVILALPEADARYLLRVLNRENSSDEPADDYEHRKDIYTTLHEALHPPVAI